MECNEIKYVLVDYIDGKFDDVIKDQINKHLQNCDSCQEEYIQMGRILDSFSKMEDVEPDNSLRTGFYQMLENEKKQIKKQSNKITFTFGVKQLLQYAAVAVFIIASGVIIYSQIQWKKESLQQIAELKSEIRELQQYNTVMTISNKTASERLKAVMATEQVTRPNDELVKALINTMNNDENLNVRMAACYALAKYKNNDMVKTSLIKSLEMQTDPLMQITLIGIMADMQDQRAKPVFERLVQEENVMKQVKDQAAEGLKILM